MPHRPGGFCNLGPERDVSDATAIWHVLSAASIVKGYDPVTDSRARSKADKAVREAVTHYWEYPRLAPSYWVEGQYPKSCLWSYEAQDLLDAGTTKGRLRLEHLHPLSLLTADLLARQHTPATLADYLTEHHRNALLIMLTRSEDAYLDKIGLKNRVLDAARPFSRYEAAGIDASRLSVPDASGCACVAPLADDPEPVTYDVAGVDGQVTGPAGEEPALLAQYRLTSNFTAAPYVGPKRDVERVFTLRTQTDPSAEVRVHEEVVKFLNTATATTYGDAITMQGPRVVHLLPYLVRERFVTLECT